MTIHSKNKGNKYELLIISFLRLWGWDAQSSRSCNRDLDNQGVDIVTEAPFNIQCKAVEKMKTSYHDILASMPTDKTPVIFHKRNNKGSVVVMTAEDFARLCLDRDRDIIKEHPIYDNKRTD
jgi:hypothetical protein